MSSESNKEYSVNWKNHMSHVRKAFDHLLTSNELTDVTLCCEGKKIGAHKMLLSACSSYFRDTFKDVPCQHPVIILYGVEYGVLSDILHFIYNGEVSVDTSKLDSFLKTAQLLQISGLTDSASDRINDRGRVEEESSTDQAPELYAEPITSSSVNETVKKGVKRSGTKEPETIRDKTAKQENDVMLISDVKCEPSELVSFEDPLEDPLLQADQGENKELFGLSTTQERGEEDFQSCVKKVHVVKEYSSKTNENGPTHYQEKIPTPRNFKRKSYYLNCVVCRRRQKRKQTSWRCRDCPQNPALCPGPCFENWHCNIFV